MSTAQEGSAVAGQQPIESDTEYAGRSASYERATGHPRQPERAMEDTEESGRVGVALGRGVAGVLLILGGLYGFLVGLAAIIKGGFYTYHSGYLYHWSISGWGWLQLALGVVIFAAGVCILLGMLWARIVGVVVTIFSAVANFLFIPYYPIWSIIVIAVDIFIIWALLSSGHRRQPV